MAEAKRDVIKTAVEGLVIKFQIADQELTLDINKCPHDIKDELMIFGAKRKVMNAAAGKETSVAISRMRETIEALESGEWNTRSTGTAEAVKAQTIAMLKGLPVNIRRQVAKELEAKIKEAGISDEELQEILNS